MAIKFKASPSIDVEDLILRVARAVAAEIAGQLAGSSFGPKRIDVSVPNAEDISIDESIIPIEISMSDIDSSNISEKLETKITVDKGLDKSKNRLAAILGKKK